MSNIIHVNQNIQEIDYFYSFKIAANYNFYFNLQQC